MLNIKRLHVSGVVLANASLDIAFHDTVFTVIFSIFMSSFLSMTNTALNLYNYIVKIGNEHNVSDKLDNISYEEYIKMFWVGLMDGDGSIQEIGRASCRERVF